MKKCKDCKVQKEEFEFYPTQGDCKNCFREKVRKNRITNIDKYREYDRERQRENYIRIFSHRYSGMLARTQGRATRKYPVEGRPICTRKEFMQWCVIHLEQFKKLHRAWKKSGWDIALTPSIDRVNNTKGYIVENIQWITKKENNKKHTK